MPLHPYTKTPLAVTEGVHLGQVSMAQAGEEEVCDLRVEEAGHYVTWGGFIAQNCGFDELTSFLESQYLYLFSRLRSSHGVPCRIRAATNPGNVGHEWVFKRFGPWLDPRHAEPVDPGVVAYFARDVDGKEVRAARGDSEVLGRTFVPALLRDNPKLSSDVAYRRAIEELDPVTREQLAKGDWLVKPGAGLYLKRSWFSADSYLDAAPSAHMIVGRCRAWDLAASVAGDWTVGTLELKLHDGTFVVADVRRMRGTPNEVDAEIEATAALDGILVTQRLPQDPGQAGVHQKSSLQKKLARYRTVFERPTGDKVTRFGPFSSACQAGNVKVVRGEWNAAWFAELEGFPEGAYDDQADSAADAHNFLTGHNVVRRTGTDSAPSGRRMDGW